MLRSLKPTSHEFPSPCGTGSGGLAGSSFTLAMLGTLEAMRYGCGVNILGGSGEQSKNVLDIMSELWNFRRAPRQLLTSDPEGHVQIKLDNGGWIKALKASSKSVRGPHPQRLRVYEIFVQHLRRRMGQTLSKDGVPAQTACIIVVLRDGRYLGDVAPSAIT